MPVLVTDELNSPEYKPRSVDYEKYFGEMGLTKEQTKNRIDMANDIEDLMLFIFSLIGVSAQYGMLDYSYIQSVLQSRFETIISNYADMDDYLQMFAQDFSNDFIEVTEVRIDKPWYTSEDRAKFIAENEANAVHNYLDFEKAIKEGYTKKQWITLMDGKERPTHAKINKKIIPIGDLFAVGDALMRFPMDTKYASDFPREIIKCRCRLKYLDRDPERAEKYEKIGLDADSENATRNNFSRTNGFIDVTSQELQNASPYSHEIVRDESYSDGTNTYYVNGTSVKTAPTESEIRIAELLRSRLGGEIHFVPTVRQPQNVSTPDLLFNGVKTDIKEISGSGKDCVRDLLKKSKSQANQFVLDFSKSKMSDQQAMEQVEKLFVHYNTKFIEKIYVTRNGELLRILKRG